jgi:hypothetical protein
MFQNFNDYLRYHNLHDDSSAFQAVLNNPEIIGVDNQ